ncbi:asparaginase, partial [Candidatus Magnetomorum sp. HK-1]
LRAFGAGDVSTNLHPAFEYLKDNEIPIIVTTQAPNGNSNFQVNEPGQKLREKELAIPAYDMSIESQTTKLAWLLAQKRDDNLTYADINREMIHDIRGEINVLKELKQ